jgi:hypothetical protein
VPVADEVESEPAEVDVVDASGDFETDCALASELPEALLLLLPA